MKKTPQYEKLEEMLRSDKIAHGGFLAADARTLSEIIDADVTALARLGQTPGSVALRMEEITKEAMPRLGNAITLDNRLEVRVEDYQGKIICPFPHAAACSKRITTVKHLATGKTICWSDLNIHLIREHSFFEGRGAMFRLEPDELVSIIF